MTTVYQRPHRGATAEWHTPPEILKALGPFDDDPCVPGRDDGLKRSWRGLVWLNPPYGPETGAWLAKLADHGEGIALVFARTDTKWFWETVWGRASALLFLRGRPHFYLEGKRAKGNSGGAMVCVAYGLKARARLCRSNLGAFVESWLKNTEP